MKKTLIVLVAVMFLFSGLAFGIDADTKAGTKVVKAAAKKDSNAKKVDPTVYVTKAGKKYHKKNCKVVKEGKKGIKLSEAVKKGLTPCAVCKPPAPKKGKKK
ncbi:MAG: hypothetical protein GY765_00755 [bacterium]|nr:hypothetical protein [bacterium]